MAKTTKQEEATESEKVKKIPVRKAANRRYQTEAPKPKRYS